MVYIRAETQRVAAVAGDGYVVDAVLQQLACGRVYVETDACRLLEVERVVDHNVELQYAEAPQRIGFERYREVVDAQPTLREDVAARERVAPDRLDTPLQLIARRSRITHPQHVAPLHQIGGYEQIGRRQRILDMRRLAAVYIDRICPADIFQMQIGVVVVPRCRHVELLLEDHLGIIPAAHRHECRRDVDILLDIVAHAATGVFAFVVCHELGSVDAGGLRRHACHSEASRKQKGYVSVRRA